MADGYLIRHLPDEGIQFILTDPRLAFVRVDDQTRLQFGGVAVTISSTFTLEAPDGEHHLDPSRTQTLGPLVALYPGTVRWLWVSPLGELTAEFADRVRVRVRPHPLHRAWSVGDLAFAPGGTD